MEGTLGEVAKEHAKSLEVIKSRFQILTPLSSTCDR